MNIKNSQLLLLFLGYFKGDKKRSLMTTTMTRALRRTFQDEKEIAKTMMLIVASFLVCWIPISLHLLGEAKNEDWIFTRKILRRFINISASQSYDTALMIKSVVVVLTLFNSLADPIIFMTRMRPLREKVLEMFCRHSPL